MESLTKINKALSRLFVRLFFDRKNLSVSECSPGHILVIRWDGKIGDAIVSSFFYREIRKLGSKKITVITTQELTSIHLDFFMVDQVVVTQSNPSLRELIRLRCFLSGIDVVVHLVETIRPSEIFFFWLLKPQLVFSLDESWGWVNMKMGQVTEGYSFAEKYEYVLQRLGVHNIKSEYIIPIQSKNSMYSPENLTWDIIFNPFGSRPDKSLTQRKSVQVLGCIANAFPSCRIGVLSSPSTWTEAQQLAKIVAKENVDAVNGIETIQNAAAIIAATKAVVSVDTGIVHIAIGLKKKLVAIYLFMYEEHNPWEPPSSLLTRVVYSYHDVLQYRRTGLKDMNRFDVKELVEGLKQLMASPL